MSAKRALCIAGAVVIPLSVVNHFVFWGPLLYALLPGLYVQLLVTGFHGGTRTEEAVAPFVGAVVNIAAYFLVIYGLGKLFRSKSSA